MSYYQLFGTNDNGQIEPIFGAYDREDVAFEKDILREESEFTKVHIIRYANADKAQDAINAILGE